MSTARSNQQYTPFNSPAPTVSLQEWAETESSNLEAQDTIRHLKEIVIPNLQERQKLQNEYWGKMWNEAQSEIEKLKKEASSDMDFLDNIQASYQEKTEQLEEADHTVHNLRKRIELLENGVTRSRAARRDTNYYKKENKRLKAQIAESESWREFLGSSCYEHSTRYEEEYKKRLIVQEKLKELEEKYERTQQNLVHCENHLDLKNVRGDKFQEIAANLRKKFHEESRKKKFAETTADKLKKELDNANNALEGFKQQLNAAKEVNEQWNVAYTELLDKYQSECQKTNEADSDSTWDNNYIHIYPSVDEPSADKPNNEFDNIGIDIPPRAGIGWGSENQSKNEEMV